MYNSQYYTCEQIDERLLQGYLDDYNSENNTNLTKTQFLNLLYNTIGRNTIIDNLVTQVGYYECNTEAGTAAKAISATGYVLSIGGSIKIKMTNANTADNVTLNINSTGAKPLYYNGEQASASNSWEANEVISVFYDGSSFISSNFQGGGGAGDGAYDVSDANDGATYENLSAALAAISENDRKGGMSVKFILRTNTGTEQEPVYKDEYVQYRYLGVLIDDTNFLNTYNWYAAGVILTEDAELDDVDIVFPLPKEYTKLKYIENTVSDNGAYIQTNLIPKDDDWLFEGSYYVKALGANDQPVWGNYIRYLKVFGIRRYSTSVRGIYYNFASIDENNRITADGFIVGTEYKFKLYIDKTNNTPILELNGTKYVGGVITSQSLITTNPIQLFKSQFVGSSLIGGMGEFKARHNGKLVFYAIPAVKSVEVEGETTEIYGMYEMVTKRFLTSEREIQFTNSDLNN